MTDCFASLAMTAFILLASSSQLAAVPTPIYSLFMDNGSPADGVDVWNNVTIDSAATNPPAAEGTRSMRTSAFSFGGGWGFKYLQPGTGARRSVDLSAYAASGELRFWAWCDTDNFDIFIEHMDTSKETWSVQGGFGGRFNQWVAVSVLLNQIAIDPNTGRPYPINDVFSPFQVNMNQAGTCYFDDIRYVNPPAVDQDVFSVAVKNVSDQLPAVGSQITWPAGTLPSGWTRADQYIELAVDSAETLGWGVQLYTNNRRSGASPTYVVNGSSNPAGLVNPADPRMTVPLAWSITASTRSSAVAAPAPADPNNNPADPHSFPWLFMKDAATPAIPTENTTAFQNADPAIVVINNVGIHFGQNDRFGNPSFGAEWQPNYIFLEANFGVGLAQTTYQTNSLFVEYFTY